PLPEIGKRFTGTRAAAHGETVGQHDRVYGAGACRAHSLDLEPRFFKKAVQNAPGESPMAASTLKREFCKLGFRHSRSPSLRLILLKADDVVVPLPVIFRSHPPKILSLLEVQTMPHVPAAIEQNHFCAGFRD